MSEILQMDWPVATVLVATIIAIVVVYVHSKETK